MPRRKSSEVYFEADGERSKSCNKCGIIKPLEDFNKDTSQKWEVRTACRECSKGALIHRNKTRSKKNHLWSKYRLRPEDYYMRLEAQGFCCAICGESEDRKTLVVDHDHSCCPSKEKTCGKCIRALICSDCNLGLGRFFDRPELLERAADYIRFWEKEVEN